MANKVEIPIDKAELVLARKNAGNVNPSIEIDDSGSIVPRNGSNSSLYSSSDLHTVMVRKAKNDGDRPKNAKSLKDCKGLKGCEFAQCAEKVFGKLPKNLIGLCSIEKK